MVKQATLLSELQSIVGTQHARVPTHELDCAVDGLSPRAIVEPGTDAEVAEILRFANAGCLAIIPRGSGHQMHIGNIPNRYDIALSLARLNKIIEHEPADLTVRCQAGITVGALDELLAPSGQIVPLTLDSNPLMLMTVGGLLALNMGYSRVAYGSPRDFTIGLKVITADGRISSAGGKVVKNVAGYDLCKLYVGSHGTLALIAEATFKVFPRPQAEESLSLEFASSVEACRSALEMRARGLGVVSAQLYRPVVVTEARHGSTVGYVLNLTFAGQSPAVKRSREGAEKLAALIAAKPFDWDPNRTAQPGPTLGSAEVEPVSVRAHLLPTQVPEFMQTIERDANGIIEAAPLLGEVTVVWPAGGDAALIDRARAAANRLGGTLEVQFCPPEIKRRIDVFGPPPPSFPLMRAVKQQFDPNNVLSPGRFVGRL